MRIGCSKLKYDFCYNLHVINEATCRCGEDDEDYYYYFMECPNYTDLRLQLFNAIVPFTYPEIGILLYGNPQLEQNINLDIFNAVPKYIISSKRFEYNTCVLPNPLGSEMHRPACDHRQETFK